MLHTHDELANGSEDLVGFLSAACVVAKGIREKIGQHAVRTALIWIPPLSGRLDSMAL